jgi:hypothetical protein
MNSTIHSVLFFIFFIPASITSFSIVSQNHPNFQFKSSKILQQKHKTSIQQHHQQHHIFTRDLTILAADVEEKSAELQVSSKDDDKTEEEDEDEWEYEEYENLNESDFYNSEWKVGTLKDGKNNIDETWTRLVVKDGEFVCIWGDGASGKWNFDPVSQFLSMSKDSFGGWLGKRIWAGTVGDYYYVQGTVRSWSPISPASVVAQWQAKRLGVDRDEAGVAPWFQQDDDEEDENDDEALATTEQEEPSASSEIETSKED